MKRPTSSRVLMSGARPREYDQYQVVKAGGDLWRIRRSRHSKLPALECEKGNFATQIAAAEALVGELRKRGEVNG